MSKIKIFSLGGLNEIGKNMYIVEIDKDIFVFDAGLKYADDKMLGIDYIIPNYDYLKANQNRIKGIFLSHGHDEQIGAIPDMLMDLKVNIYGSKFTLDSLNEELLMENINCDSLIELKPHKKVSFGENSIFPISLSHNVPEALGYVLYTKDGAIFYTGNFVFDPSMLGSYKTDIGKLAYVGKQGVLCLMSESIYAEKIGYTTPNHRASEQIDEIISNNDGRILFNILWGHIYRIQEIFNAIINTDREVVIIGKRLEKSIINAIDNGYLEFDKKRIGNVRHINSKNAIIIVSDEREKPFSNIRRIVKGYDKFIKLEKDDTVVFASPIYDGMEKSSTEVFDQIASQDINLIIFPKKCLSFHASSEDLMLMLDLMKPKYYFPIIGEYHNQVANGEIAKKLGMKDENILLKTNGQVINIIDGELVNDNEVIKADDILIDGKTVGDIGELVLKDREMLSENGVVIITVTLDKLTKKIISGPEIITHGFIYVKENLDLMKETKNKVIKIVEENTKPMYIDYNKVRTNVRDALGKYYYQETECKPMILIVMNEV